MAGCRNIFFMPEKELGTMQDTQLCGDLMPFYWEGCYHLFYLHKYSVYHVSTADFVTYSEPRLAIPNGGPEEQDWHIGTGCAFEKDGKFHFFYTGFNSSFKKREGGFEQVLMHATSDNLEDWKKDSSFFILPFTELYKPLHWRDPQVFWNEGAGEYWMAVTAAEKDTPRHRGGCTHIIASKDFINWEHCKPIYSPHMFEAQECHDIFRMREWWYMVFSTYTRWWETRYRMAKSPEGPWIIPKGDDMFDGRAFYAAKTVYDGKRRFLVGWLAFRENGDDLRKYQWGGSTLVHELVQRTDGTLGVKLIREIDDSFKDKVPLSPVSHLGLWKVGNVIEGKEEYGFGWLEFAHMPDVCILKAKISWEEGTKACGFMLKTSGSDLNKWCQVRMELDQRRLVFQRSNSWDVDHNFIEERPINLGIEREADVKLVLCGNIVIAYVNDDVVLSARAYDFEAGLGGVFVEGGKAVFMDLCIMKQ